VAVRLAPSTPHAAARQATPRADATPQRPRVSTSGGSAAHAVGVKQCKTCASRKYVDQSGDLGVSFKSPTHVPAAAAASAVSGHEQEHASRNQDAADAQGQEVVYQNVQVYTDRCPECGRIYVAGGKTTTVTRSVAPRGTGRFLDALA
jgi:hypothetical protein